MSDNYNPQGPGSDGHPTEPMYNPGGFVPAGGPPPASNTKWYLMIAGLLVVIAGLLAVAFGALPFGSGDDTAEATYVVVDQPPPAPVFEPAGSGGQDPFFPINVQLLGFEQATGQPTSPAEVETGLYGGTVENTCDPQRLIDFLLQNPAKGQAWATVQGITFEQVPGYINSLTPRVLAEPTTVLNHGYDEQTQAPYEIESTLAAGTAVLVDAEGNVRTRCYCGNPIKPKPVGHKPPRCLVLTQSVFTEPRSGTSRSGVLNSVVLTGRVTDDLAWTEVAWGGRSETETGWTPAENVLRGYCLPDVVLPPPATVAPTPEITVTPGPSPTPTPTPIPTATPRPTVPPPLPQPTTPRPTTPPQPTTTPTPLPTLTVTPTPTITPTPAPLRLQCSVSNTRPQVNEQITISGSVTPADPSVTFTIDHGDGTLDPNNPSFAFYRAPGSYDVRLIAAMGGQTTELFCGTVRVEGNPCESVNVVGLSESAAVNAAAAKGCTTRVVHRDGEDFIVTQEFNSNRINLWIDDGVVFRSSVG